MYERTRHDVFIVCDDSDQDWAETCYKTLTQPPYGLKVATPWLDFVAGKTKQVNYNNMMMKSDKLLFCFTHRFVDKIWSRYLLSSVEDHFEKIIPIRIEKDCQLPDELDEKVPIDGSRNYFTALYKALEMPAKGKVLED